MAYVSVQGGADAIRNSQSLLEYQRVRGDSPPMDLSQIRQQLGLLVDRIMGEGGLFSPYHSALAIKQTQGDTTEAALYLRAFRSTLRRLPDSLPINTEHMILSRRISSAFKDIPGGQILGATPDYTQRILDFSLAGETAEESGRRRDACLDRLNGDFEPLDPSRFTKVVEVLRREGLVKRYEPTEEEPGIDVTRDSVLFPMGRDGRLQMMVRSETGGLLALGYSALRGSFGTHPTIAELRIGRVPVNIRHPFHPGETITVGLMEITEAEIVASPEPSQENETPTLSLGYGISFGRNELKAISMATLDRTMKADSGAGPAADSEYVLMHTEGIESSGFCLHLKLPHYVTFQSKLDNLRKRHLRDREPAEVNEGTGEVVHG